MSIDNSLIQGGGAKGLPRSMRAFYESLLEVVPDPDAPLAQYLQPGIYYPSDTFTDGTLPAYLAAPPFDAEVVAVAMVITRTITGAADVDFTIDGGPAIATLNTGAGTQGLLITAAVDPPAPIDINEVLAAEADGVSTGNSAVTVFATLRSR
jgi:hypothetical protein